MKRFSFPRKKRLVSNKQFEAVLARGLRASNGLLTLYMAENGCGYPRLGVSVGKSHGNAVVRNRLKRLLREVFRQSQDRIPAGFDYLLMISPQWSKKINKAQGIKEAIRPEPYPRCQLAQQTEGVGIRPTFEQVKTSFLALVATAVGKRNQN